MKALERLADELLEQVRKQRYAGECVKYDEFAEEMLAKLRLSAETLDLIVAYLESRDQCTQVHEGSVRIIKFGAGKTIDQRDISLFKLEVAKDLIAAETAKLEAEMERCRDEARDCIRADNKLKAKLVLKRKHRLEALLHKKQSQYDNIEILSDQILNSDSNKLIVDAFAKSAQVLKSAEVIPEDYEEMISEIEEAADLQNHMLNGLSRPLDGSQIDDGDLEKELREMIGEQQIDEQLKRLDQLRPAMGTSGQTDRAGSGTRRTRIGLSDDL